MAFKYIAPIRKGHGERAQVAFKIARAAAGSRLVECSDVIADLIAKTTVKNIQSMVFDS
jgi:hypothetical protein